MIALVAGLFAAILAFQTLWLIVVIGLFLFWPFVVGRICQRAGFSGWWGLAALFPPTFVILLWVLALSDWPTTTKVQIIPPRVNIYRR